MQAIMVCCYVALLVVLVGLQAASAIDAPHGAYLGCFDATKVSLAYQVPGTLVQATLSTCTPSCRQENYGLAFITTDYKCYCSHEVPPEAAKLTYGDCLLGGRGVAGFYLHKDPAGGSTTCRVSNPSMSTANWKIAHGATDVAFNAASNSVTIKIGSPTGGARLESKDGKFLYGVYQVEALISGAPGIVSAFYTRSSDVYPNDLVADFSEVDWEWVNGQPCEPASLWLNSFTRASTNGAFNIPPAQYQKTLGTTSLRSDRDWLTYTVNWQPDRIVWSLNGKFLQMSHFGQPYTSRPSPDLASSQAISVWTHNTPSPNNWGGMADFQAGPQYSSFRNVRRVLCDGTVPTDPVAARLAMGPAWLYGLLEIVTGQPGSTSPSPVVIPSPAISPVVNPPSSPSPTVSPSPPPAGNLKVLAGWQQCGGMGGTCGSTSDQTCADQAFAGYVCASGYICQRKDSWYWQCVVSTAPPATPNTSPTPSPNPSSPSPSSPSPPPSGSSGSGSTGTGSTSIKTISGWQQCGGRGGSCGNPPDKNCADKAYEGYVCATGFTCKRNNEWYWQCDKLYSVEL